MRQPFEEKPPFLGSPTRLRAHKVSAIATLILILLSINMIVLFLISNMKGKQYGKGWVATFGDIGSYGESRHGMQRKNQRSIWVEHERLAGLPFVMFRPHAGLGPTLFDSTIKNTAMIPAKSSPRS